MYIFFYQLSEQVNLPIIAEFEIQTITLICLQLYHRTLESHNLCFQEITVRNNLTCTLENKVFGCKRIRS